MKVACIIPVPDLTKYGYSRVAWLTISNHLKFFDLVCLYTYNSIDIKLIKEVIPSSFNNYIILDKEIPKLSKDQNGEIWNMDIAAEAASVAMKYASVSVDFVIFSTLNHYFELLKKNTFLKYLSKLKSKNLSYGYYNVAPITVNGAFYPKASYPYIWNSTYINNIYPVNDAITHKSKLIKYSNNVGFPFTVYDILYEQSYKELVEKNRLYFSKTFKLVEHDAEFVLEEVDILNYFQNKINSYFTRRITHKEILLDVKNCYSEDSVIHLLSLKSSRSSLLGFLRYLKYKIIYHIFN